MRIIIDTVTRLTAHTAQRTPAAVAAIIGWAVLLCAACPATESKSAPAPGAAAETLFKSAFTGGIQLEAREKILREVVRQHPGSIWTDDALWVLARLADHRGDAARAVLWRRRLIEDFQNPALEPFTARSPPFLTSALPNMLHIMESLGRRYAHDRGQVFSFNPLPFSVHNELGQVYERMGYDDLALREYRAALRSIPSVDLLSYPVEQRIQTLERSRGEPDNGDPHSEEFSRKSQVER